MSFDNSLQFELEFIPEISESSDLFNLDHFKDMMIRLVKLLRQCVGKTDRFDQFKMLKCNEDSKKRIKMAFQYGQLNYAINCLYISIDNPTYLSDVSSLVLTIGPYNWMVETVNHYVYSKVTKDYAKLALDTLFDPDAEDHVSIDLEKDVMEWLLDYTNAADIFDL